MNIALLTCANLDGFVNDDSLLSEELMARGIQTPIGVSSIWLLFEPLGTILCAFRNFWRRWEKLKVSAGF